MNDWVAGYRAALADIGRLSPGRVLTELLADLEGDALAIEREQTDRIRRRRLRAVREAMQPLDDPP